VTGLPTFDPGFSTTAMTAIFSPGGRIRRMLEVEAALARVEAAARVIPPAAAALIEHACQGVSLDAESMLRQGWTTGTPVMPVLDALREALPADAASHLHRGATSQDIIDTGLVLQIRDGMGELASALDAPLTHLGRLMREHAQTPHLGRTWLQAAAPTSFGLRIAGWAEPLVRLRAALEAAASHLPLQFGGPVGNLARLGSAGVDVMERLAADLGLAVPALPWHADRSHLVAAIDPVRAVARGMAKMAVDVALLAQAGEVHIPAGGSSSMPHKRNPIDAVRAIAAAQACEGAASVISGGRPHELDRGLGGWQAESWAVPMVFHTAAATVEAMDRCVAGLQADVPRMASNLAASGVPDDGLGPAGFLIGRVLTLLDTKDRR
jgi:3-carboxy-cis,cis-muconate cycloisomerase